MKNYYIKDGYQINPEYNTSEETSGEAFWDETHRKISERAQYYVYRMAWTIAKRDDFKTVLDVGCGTALILNRLFGAEFDLYGLDQKSGVDFCKAHHARGHYLEENLDSPTYKIKKLLPRADLIISADVIEHLPDPDKLLNYIKNFADDKSTIVISTPERLAMHGKEANSPIDNPYHIREWSYDEFRQYIESSGFEIIKHTTVFANMLKFDLLTLYILKKQILAGLPLKTTQVVICKVKT